MEHYDWNDGWQFTPVFDPAIVRPESPELELEEDSSKEKAEFNRLTALILVACLLVLAAGAGICIWILRRKRKEDTE